MSYLTTLAVIRDRGGHGEIQHFAFGREAEARILAQPTGAFLQSHGGLALGHEPVIDGVGPVSPISARHVSCARVRGCVNQACVFGAFGARG